MKTLNADLALRAVMAGAAVVSSLCPDDRAENWFDPDGNPAPDGALDHFLSRAGEIILQHGYSQAETVYLHCIGEGLIASDKRWNAHDDVGPEWRAWFGTFVGTVSAVYQVLDLAYPPERQEAAPVPQIGRSVFERKRKAIDNPEIMAGYDAMMQRAPERESEPVLAPPDEPEVAIEPEPRPRPKRKAPPA